jgi:hypothetical protein
LNDKEYSKRELDNRVMELLQLVMDGSDARQGVHLPDSIRETISSPLSGQRNLLIEISITRYFCIAVAALSCEYFPLAASLRNTAFPTSSLPAGPAPETCGTPLKAVNYRWPKLAFARGFNSLAYFSAFSKYNASNQVYEQYT